MKRIEKAQLLLCVALLWFAQSVFASSNSNPGLYYGYIPTPGQWNSYFSSKLDYLPGTLNSIPYWDASGNLLYAPASGDCTAAANVFTCTTMGGYSFASPPPTGIGNVTPSPGAFTAISAQSGVAATGAYTASYTDGTVVDYQTGNGRISVGSADTLSFYSGGIGSALMAKMTPASGVQITGTTTNDNASAGYVGEYVTATAATGSVSVTSGVDVNITSISLTAGDWDIYGIVAYSAAATTSVTMYAQGISTTSATFGTFDTYTQHVFSAIVPGAIRDQSATPLVRLSLASTTTVYLIGYSVFTVSTMTAGGTIRARRVR